MLSQNRLDLRCLVMDNVTDGNGVRGHASVSELFLQL